MKLTLEQINTALPEDAAHAGRQYEHSSWIAEAALATGRFVRWRT